MLDTDTKRRIDTARDILVGKVPDPKSQVEQITIALIYKFMDDMDAEAEELGGHRKFFANGYARYGWAKLMRSGLGGHETLNLYAEAIAKMPENPGIPPLFRDIFKNAYLPYRDPETLRAFLKIIDEFEYDHSERLGDAFEYLLSVLGSQGDAGQFRTPRHIIDFIVAVVDPKKSETVLDPACGTAGFLISSYKHILKANADADGNCIDGARAVLDNYRSRIPIHPDWPMVPIRELASVESGFAFPLDRQGLTEEEIPFLKVSDMNLPGNEIRIVTWNNAVSRATLRELKASFYPAGTVIFPKIGAAIATNKKRLLTRESTFDNNVMGIVPNLERLVPEFLHTWLLGFDLSSWASEAQPPSMRKTVVEAHKMPCPDIEVQRSIVAEIEAEQTLVAANRELIARFEKKIKATLARAWGEDEPAAAEV